MKILIWVCIYALFGLWLFMGLIYGYGSILNKFDLLCVGNSQDLFNALYKFTFRNFISYLLFSCSLWFLYKWKLPFIKLLSIIGVLIFLYESFILFWKEFYRYKDTLDYECDSLAYLINESGTNIHLFYILPFIFALLHAIYVGFLYFRFGRENEK